MSPSSLKVPWSYRLGVRVEPQILNEQNESHFAWVSMNGQTKTPVHIGNCGIRSSLDNNFRKEERFIIAAIEHAALDHQRVSR